MSMDPNDLQRYLAESWTSALAQILESMIDQKPRLEWKPSAAPPDQDTFWWEQSLNLDPAPLLWVAAPRESWNELGGRTLRAAGIDTVEADDARSTYLEIQSQSLAAVAQSLSQKMGGEVTCAQGGQSAPPTAAGWIAVQVSFDALSLPLYLGFAASLAHVLAQPDSPEQQGEPSSETPQTAAITAAAPPPSARVGSRTLDLLLDVELPVSVSFGRAELPLKDVLKLTTGSIVELNRGVSEPVEVIVNNCVVARGEVVVMDGNYGVRIHQIISPQERLRTLK